MGSFGLITLVLIAGLAFAFVAAGFLYQQIGLRRDAKRCPAPGRMIASRFGRFHLHEQGKGTPAVVFEAGIGASSLNWNAVQRAIASFSHAITYDRAGLGWSDLTDRPRTPALIAEELQELLRTAGVEAPFVLVGHSFGGLVVREFARRYPKQTAGLVLVDALLAREWCPVTEDNRARLRRGILFSRRGRTLARFGVVRGCLALLQAGNSFVPKVAARAASGKGLQVTERLAAEVRKMPPELWPAIAAHWSNPKSFEGMARHLESLPESCRHMLDAALPDDIPVIVITKAEITTFDEPHGPNVKHIVAARSGHWVQLDEPELVISAIRAVVDQVRSGDHQATP